MAAEGGVVVHNMKEWLAENEKFFLPPVCNKMMHEAGQMKSFFVGGPNQRKDYHIEEGEELFYMVKGDMCLKVVEKGKHRDIPIKEGEIFLLPARIPHSPQRQKDTIGLVLERERALEELDALRYFVDGTTESLYEEWFHVEDLGTQLAPVIKRFFASEQYKTGKPIPGTIPENPPIKVDEACSINSPFTLQKWIDDNLEEINSKGKKSMFADHFQFSVTVLGPGEDPEDFVDTAEVWIWQMKGTSDITAGNAKKKMYSLNEGDIMLIPKGDRYSTKRGDGCLCLVCYQDPTKKVVPEVEKVA